MSYAKKNSTSILLYSGLGSRKFTSWWFQPLLNNYVLVYNRRFGSFPKVGEMSLWKHHPKSLIIISFNYCIIQHHYILETTSFFVVAQNNSISFSSKLYKGFFSCDFSPYDWPGCLVLYILRSDPVSKLLLLGSVTPLKIDLLPPKRKGESLATTKEKNMKNLDYYVRVHSEPIPNARKVVPFSLKKWSQRAIAMRFSSRFFHRRQMAS